LPRRDRDQEHHRNGQHREDHPENRLDHAMSFSGHPGSTVDWTRLGTSAATVVLPMAVHTLPGEQQGVGNGPASSDTSQAERRVARLRSS
jgi:hypothetical protein